MSKRPRDNTAKAALQITYAAHMENLARGLDCGSLVELSPESDPAAATADFTVILGKQVNARVVWAAGSDMWQANVIAQRVADLRRTHAEAPVYVFMTRNKGTLKAYSERQREFIAKGLLGLGAGVLTPGPGCGGGSSSSSSGSDCNGGSVAAVKVVAVADEFEVLEWVKRLAEGCTGSSRYGTDQKGPATTPHHGGNPNDSKSWDELAVGSLEKAVPGLGKLTARRVLQELGSVKQVSSFSSPVDRKPMCMVHLP